MQFCFLKQFFLSTFLHRFFPEKSHVRSQFNTYRCTCHLIYFLYMCNRYLYCLLTANGSYNRANLIFFFSWNKCFYAILDSPICHLMTRTIGSKLLYSSLYKIATTPRWINKSILFMVFFSSFSEYAKQEVIILFDSLIVHSLLKVNEIKISWRNK